MDTKDLPLTSVVNFIEENWQRFINYLETSEGVEDAEAVAEEYFTQLRNAAGFSS